jgi:hypothetical protein
MIVQRHDYTTSTMIVADNLLKLVVAKGIATGILGFDHSIGIQHEAVPCPDGYVAKGVVGIREYAK